MRNIVIVLFFFTIPSQAQKVAHDSDNLGYRLIDTYTTPVLTPKGSTYPISISLNYYQGFSNPYIIRLYSRYEISKTDELVFSMSDDKEMHLYAYQDDTMYSNFGLPIKKKPVYDVLYQLDEQQLNDLLSLSVVGVKIGSGNEWHSKDLKNNKIEKWLKSNYKAIQKRLAKQFATSL